jgi:hypothetical protein
VVAFASFSRFEPVGKLNPAPPRGVPRVAALCPYRSVSILVFLAGGGNSKKEWAAGGRGGFHLESSCAKNVVFWSCTYQPVLHILNLWTQYFLLSSDF